MTATTTTGQDDGTAARGRLADGLPRALADLADLVRIPSVSALAAETGDETHLLASAEAVAALLRGAGLDDVTLVRGQHDDGRPGAPAVLARRPAPAGAPTVLLYAHHDVQPTGDTGAWTSPPFTLEQRGRRLYGRGAADDKAGVVVHLAALRAVLAGWGPDDGVGVTVFVEGEEEVGSPTFADLLRRHAEALAADVVVVADSDNWSVDVPSLTTSLRGLVEVDVTVRTLDHAVHSGMVGGPVVDAATALVRLLDRLRDDSGAVAVPGLASGPAAAVPFPEERLRADAGVLDGVELLGTGPLPDRLWTQPALTVVATDLPALASASNTLQPAATARVSLRVAPGQPPAEGFAALRDHLLASVPFGARVEVVLRETGSGFAADTTGPVHALARACLAEAWGVADGEVVDAGVGGSIPFVADLAAANPGAAVLVTGVEDPDTRAHGIDESLSLDVLERAAHAEVLLLSRVRAVLAGP